MMKKYIIFLSALLFSASSFARQLTLSEAVGRMKDGSTEAKRVIGKNRYQLEYTATRDGMNLLYVINNSNGTGYTILSADDMAPAVLGYGDKGNFCIDSAPEQVKWWLSQYEAAIAEAIERGKPIQVAKVSHKEVSYLLDTQWGQGAPYNLLCTDMGYNAPSGCVATAMSQIMYYHKWPEKGTGKKSYSSNGVIISSNFSEHTYEWDKIRPTYTTDCTAEEGMPVAQLLKDCGVAVTMQYGRSGSGAYTHEAPSALCNFFGYNKGVKYHNRVFYTDEQWEQTILEELDNARPILYSGVTVNHEGHAFVCDGYDGKGYYHINWGWDGSLNGYYLMSGNTVLSPYGNNNSNYSEQQAMITNIEKDCGTGELKGFLCAYSGCFLHLDGTQLTAQVNVYNMGTASDNSKPTIGIQAVKDGKVTSTYKLGETGFIGVGSGLPFSTIVLTSKMSDGIYTFYPVYSYDASARKPTWNALPVPAYYDYAQVQITSGVPQIINDGYIDTETGIQAPSQTEKVTEGWFDLQGRPMVAPTRPGLYIHDGKKVKL